MLTISRAADATSHLFFAYLRTLGPAKQGPGSISMLPRSLQMLLQDTEYPPKRPVLMQASTYKVVMIVESVSPTPFALLRRGNHFQYREDSLQHFSEYEDPVAALTEECRRVLRAVAAANQTQAVSSAKHSTSLRDASWSRFEDIGFQSTLAEDEEDDMLSSRAPPRQVTGLRRTPASGAAGGRPTTPSWADFLSSGFVDERTGSPTSLLPPDKVLPPIDIAVRGHSSHSHMPRLESEREVEQGELASINRVDLDEAFWWVWMISLAPEETADRKSAFGRCAVIETIIRNGRWLVFEEVIRGAAAEPQQGAYVAQKKSFFSWRRKDKDKSGVNRSKSGTKAESLKNSPMNPAVSKTSLGPDQQAKIQAAAQQLQAKQQRERQQAQTIPTRRGRTDAELMAEKTQSVMTLQPMIMKEASPAMKWANRYDKDTIRDAYLANSLAGRGIGQSTMQSNGLNGHPPDTYASLLPPSPSMQSTQDGRGGALSPIPASERGRETPLPAVPREEEEQQQADSIEMVRDNMFSPEPAEQAGEAASPKQHKKLQKDEKKAGGFRRLFGRGRRSSKVPDSAPAEVAAMLEAERAAATPEPIGHETPVKADTPQQGSPGQQTPRRDAPAGQMPISPLSSGQQAEAERGEPTYEPSVNSEHEDVSRVNTAEAQEAQNEFSRFDQGPLADQPAFVPDDEDDADDAAPPPIQRHRSPAPPEPERQEPEPEPARKIKPRPKPVLEPTDGPAPAIERWAQIKKNAAERAAAAQKQRQDGQSQLPVPSKKPEVATDSSGEESKYLIIVQSCVRSRRLILTV